MKSTWAFLLGLLVSATPAAAQVQFTYTISGGAVTIIGYSGFAPTGVLAVPATLDNLPVTGIGMDAFNGLTSATNVMIPASVTNIGAGAFSGCAYLTAIMVDPQNSSYYTTNGVLFDRTLTTLVEFPGGVAGSYAIPGSVTNIGAAAFEQCDSLTNVTIPVGVSSIGEDAFRGCTGLTNVAIPGSVTSIGDGAFTGCASLTAITVDAQNVFYSSTNGVLLNKTQTTLIEFPGGLTGGYTIPGGVTSVESNAFEDCRSLTNVTIPGSVSNIGVSAFLGCARLAAITVDAQNSNYSSTNGVLFDKSQTTLVEFPGGLAGSYTIPGSVTNIAGYAFEDCQALAGVTIPGGGGNIGAGAFENCYGLARATIASGVAGIGSNAFKNCYSLTSVTIPGSVTSIGEAAFDYCLSLTSVTISAGVTTIGDDAFVYCSSLTSAAIPDTVMHIGEAAFAYCSSLAAVTIPTGIGGIGPYTFYECADLTSVMMPGSVTNIGTGAFEQCYSLAGVTIPAGVMTIGDYAFSDCTSLIHITIPASVSAIGDAVFSDCASLTAISVETQNLFYSSANGVLFDENQTTLVEFPCGLAGSYTIPSSVTRIGDHAFVNCQSLTNVTIPGSVAGIGSNAFENCYSLTSITIPGSVTNIGENAFGGTGLASFYFTGNAPAVDSSVFPAGNNPAIFYLPGTIGWAGFTANTGLSATLWNPVIQTGDGGFGVQSNQFGFNIIGPNNLVVAVEACVNLAAPVWTALKTVTLTNGSAHFSEPVQTNLSASFYGLGFP